MNTTRLFVKHLLQNADRFEWSIQGLGMLRTYLSREVRLHIWDSSAVVPAVSSIHDHPWDFESQIIAGRLVNRLYEVVENGRGARSGLVAVGSSPTHMGAVIQCGAKACVVGEPKPHVLRVYDTALCISGGRYRQHAEELHESVPQEDGTITLVTRRFKKDTEHARVFWPVGTEWVDAKPRPATDEEVNRIVARGLERLMIENRTEMTL